MKVKIRRSLTIERLGRPGIDQGLRGSAAIAVLLGSGLRASELLGLDVGQLVNAMPPSARLRRSGVRAAVDGQVCTVNERRLRTSNERYQRRDVVDMPISIKRNHRLLTHRPIAGGGVEIGVDGARLNVVHRDAAISKLAGQSLSKHLDGTLRCRVRRHGGEQHAFAQARADHDDSATRLHVLQGRLRRDEGTADVDRKDAVKVGERGFFDFHRNDRAGVVHEYIKPAKRRDRLLDRVLDGVRVGGVRLDRDRLPAIALDCFHQRRGGVRALGVSDRHARSFGSKRLAIAAPMPREPPVTSAALLLNLDMLNSFGLREYCASRLIVSKNITHNFARIRASQPRSTLSEVAVVKLAASASARCGLGTLPSPPGTLAQMRSSTTTGICRSVRFWYAS